MRIRGGLVGLLFFLLAGCSFILDPEECQGDGDCANGQSCSSGICLGPVIPLTPEDAGGDVLNADMAAPDQGLPPDEGVDPDRGLPPDAADADVPPARPPICEILEPVGPEVGPLSADRITVRGVVGDPDTAVADRQATFAGAPVALDGDGMFEVEVELAEGRNVLELTAIDDTMLSCRAQVVVRSDRTAPVLVIEEPNGDVPVNGSFNPFRVSGTVEDTGGISAIEVTLNDAPVDGPAPAVGAFGFPVALVPGANAIEVTAVDQAGNRSAPVRRVITLDEEPPVVTIESPEDGTRTPESMIRVAGQVTTDGVGEFRSRLALRVNGRAVPLAGNAGISDEEGRFDLTVALEVGDNRIEVDGNDRADNHGVGAVTVVREDPAPCVAIEAPADDAFVGTPDVEITGTVCPAVTAVELRVGNGAAVAGVVADGRFTGTATLPAGRASTVTVRALTDDNQSAEDSVRLFHDDTPPTVRINVPAIGACLNTATIRVCGQADDPESGIASVTVNAVAGAFLNGDYCAELPLPDGANQP
ncbi:MAG: hypothetical protein KC549_04310, partial [Myxococcales bacterium]|nr:hypothetical protein [Myxococcales bacterium]